MNSVKGSPAHEKKVSIENVSYDKAVILSEFFFLTFSCTDLHWEEIPKIISKVNGLQISEDELKSLTYFEKC